MASLYASVDRVVADATKLDPIRVLLFLFALPFWVLGWTARVLWVVVAIAVQGAKHGWRTAATQIEARQAAAEAARAG